MNMSIVESLLQSHALWSIASQRLPPNLYNYNCQFIAEEYQISNQIKQKNYLKFTSKQNASTFQIVINQVQKPSFTLYQAEINVDDIQNPKASLNNKIGSICFTDVKGYQKPPYQFKEIEIDQDCSFDNPGQALLFLDFGNNENSSSEEEAKTINDFGPQNEKAVRLQILIYIKSEANRFKKLKDIKAHLINKLHINVPDNHLKKIVADFCGTHLMDKKRGYLVHEEYLSQEQKVKKRLQEEETQQREKQKVEKGRRKGGKKESKNDKKKIVISREEVVRYASERQDTGSIRKIINQMKASK